MRGRKQRHPVLEIAVFAAALLLAGFIAREAWNRRPAPQPPAPPRPSSMTPAVLTPTHLPSPSTAAAPRAETGVMSVAPIKLTRVQRRKTKRAAVPSPK